MSKLAYYVFTLTYAAGLNIGKYIYMDYGAKVTDGIYIGSLATATNTRSLTVHNIGAIVNLSGSKIPTLLPVFELIMDDTIVTPQTMDSYIQSFSSGVEAIRAARAGGKNVLINCAAGINRSATLIGFYLIQCGWTYPQVYGALSAANAARGVPILTNDSFRYLLQACDSFKQNFDKKIKP